MTTPSRTRRGIEYLGAAGSRAVSGAAPALVGHDPRFPGWQREGEFLFRRRRVFPGLGVSTWPEPFSSEASSPRELVFYDTETTGLSGGAGSVIFLFGSAWCEESDLVVEQLFLSDFPGEPEFLEAVQNRLGPFRAFVSYNGKTFDSHLLRTRFLMNRIDWHPGPQVDLLHHARRLWRSVTGVCSLTSIESQILGFTREMDVAGEDIPVIWLDFLRTGAVGMLPAVFDHNVMDITSLARMYTVIGKLLGGDVDAARVDEGALGRWLIASSPRAGAEILADAFERGDMDAGMALSLHHKRGRRWEDAVPLWEAMIARSKSVFAALELAKHHEHRNRNPKRALEMVELLLSWNLPLDRRMREALRVRLARLKRKLGGSSSTDRGI
jgi:uncharacterized protein